LELETLNALYKLKIDDKKKFWIVFDWLKREYFDWIKNKIKDINWEEEWLNDFERILDEAIENWSHFESTFSQYENIPTKRLKGILYEVLFYISCIKTSSIFKGSWIMELNNDPLCPNREPPWFEVVPIYDILPKTFNLNDGSKKVLKAPQIEADFLILYWDKMGTHPLVFVDVKKNLNKYKPKDAVWNALGCKWSNAILAIATPKKDFPRDLKDWDIKHVCWNCGHLNVDSACCEDCGKSIS